jgi:hypothetical protein
VIEADVIQWVGVSVAFVGTPIAAPDGVRLLWRGGTQSWHHFRTRFVGLLPGWLKRRFRQPVVRVTQQLATPAAVVDDLDVAVQIGWEEDAPLADKVNTLHHAVELVFEQLRQVRQETRGAHSALERRLDHLVDALRTADKDLADRLDKAEAQSARIDARGVILLGFGVILTGIPAQLAAWPPLGWFLVAVAVVVTPPQVWRAWTEARTARLGA